MGYEIAPPSENSPGNLLIFNINFPILLKFCRLIFIKGLAIRTKDDWQDRQLQVAMQHYFPSFLVL